MISFQLRIVYASHGDSITLKDINVQYINILGPLTKCLCDILCLRIINFRNFKIGWT